MKKFVLFFFCCMIVYNARADFQTNSIRYRPVTTYEAVVVGASSTGINIPATVRDNSYGRNYTVVGIADGAFAGNSNITHVSISSGITYIGARAFQQCPNLLSVSIPNTVTSIGERAFSGCYKINQLTVPNSVSSIGGNAFANVKNVVYSGSATGSPWGALTHNGFVQSPFIYADSTRTTLTAVTTNSMAFITIPDGVTIIGEYAFYYNTGLVSISFPNSLHQIHNNAFEYCSNLIEINWPDSLNAIGEHAFSRCTSLTSLTIPNTVTTIEQSTFSFCSGLTSITFPNTLTTIKMNAFCGCTNIQSITIPNSVISLSGFNSCTGLTNVELGESIDSINKIAFEGCSNLSSITLPNSVGYIDSNAFSRSGLVSIIIPENVTSINCESFSYCFSLQHITIGKNVHYINDNAFKNCTSLQTITLKGTQPPLFTTNTFDGVPTNTHIIIPCGKTSSYQSRGWNRFSNIIEENSYSLIFGDIENGSASIVSAGTCTSPTIIQAYPYTGYYFINWSDGSVENPRSLLMVEDIILTPQFDNHYSVVASSNNLEKGIVIGSDTVVYMDTVILTAMPYYGYHFTQWDDGNTDNPRTIIVTGNFGSNATFEPNQYELIVASSNNTYGNTSGAGIYNFLSQCSISAMANHGYHFTQWSDGNTDNPRIITISNDTFFTAQFERNYYFVTGVSSQPERGLVTGSNSVEYLEYVTLLATPNNGYHFERWTDNNTDNPREVQATDNISLTAIFTPNQYSISLSVDSLYHGYVSGEGRFDYLSNCSINATSFHGYHFSRWNDDNISNPRTITITQDTSFTALFERNQYHISGMPNDSIRGIVIGNETALYLDTVTLTAFANYGYHFMHWSDNNTYNPRVIVATDDVNITAIFEFNQYSITLDMDTNIHGSVVGGGSYNYLSECSINANANYGYHFTTWSDGDTSNPRTVTLTQDTSFTALFGKNTYAITAISTDNIKGTVSGSTSIEYLDSVTITATPNNGYHFTAWNDGNTDNPRTIVVTRDSLFTATFDYNQYAITLNVDTNIHGAVVGGGSYNYLSEQTVNATANYGYHFTAWSDGVTDNPRTLILTQDTAFTALFAKNTYSIAALSADSVKGHAGGSGTSEYLDTAILTAIATYGYHFTQWSDGNTDNPRMVQVTRDSVFTAQFDYNQYNIALAVDTVIHGSVGGAGNYNYLSSRIISATANYGYHFTQWNDGDTSNPRTLTLTQDTMFTALFAKNTYSVSAVSSDTVRGMVFGDASSEYLDSVTITAFPNYGYHFTAWNDGDTNNPRTIIVLKDSVLTAYFDYNQYTLALEVDTIIHGSVVGDGTYNYLSERTISATANYGYHFSNWNDGDTANPRTVTITQDTTLTAIFAKNTYLLVAESDDNAMGNVSGDGLFDYLDTATLEATAAPHYHFVHWSDGNTNNPRHYVITEDDTITAFFAIDTHHVSVESCDIAFGSVEGDGDYEYRTPVTVTATAYSGYTFVRWSNGITHNPYTFAVLQDTTLIAVFEAETQGIDNIVDAAVSVYTHGGRIIVEMEREDEINIYDIYGRKIDGGRKSHFEVPCSGAYLIKIGNHPARRVVVVR